MKPRGGLAWLRIVNSTFLAIHDFVLRMFPPTEQRRKCAGRRQAVVISALLYPAQKLGEDALSVEFVCQRRELCRHIRELYCIRSITTTLQELRRDGFITYRTDGRYLFIRLADKWLKWLQMRARQLGKCKIAEPSLDALNKKKTYPPRVGPHRGPTSVRDDREPILISAEYSEHKPELECPMLAEFTDEGMQRTLERDRERRESDPRTWRAPWKPAKQEA
jgi:hypothetical protein